MPNLNTDQPDDDPTQEEIDKNDIAELFNDMSAKFDELCQKRHEDGQAEYGVFTFLENDIVRMMAEELADTANYCRMQFIKLMILQGALVEQLGEDAKIDMGAQAFKGTKTGWKQ